VKSVLRTPGHPLDQSTRRPMEQRFGRDFSRVRVHTGSDAEQSARAVNAEAWTVGQHIAFGRERFSPRTLAHELTHTVQQENAAGGEIAMGRSGDALESEADRVGAQRGPVQVAMRTERPTLSRTNEAETQQVLATGAAAGSGLQFYPTALAGTRIGPVTPGETDTMPRLSVIVGERLTIDMLAQALLPLWNSAAPFAPPDGSPPVPPTPITAETLARALIVYNQFRLGLPAGTNWRAGFRFPLPVDIEATTNVGIVHTSTITNLAAAFAPAWEPLRSMPAPGLTAATPTDLAASVTGFLAENPTATGRGYALLARSLANAAAARELVLAVLAGSDAFDVALEFMNGAVNHQIGLLASQTAGAAILARIRALLSSPPSGLAQQRQTDVTRALDMLNRFATTAARPTPAVQVAAPAAAAAAAPTAISAAGTAFIAGFEGFIDHLYDDPAEGHHCTVGFGHLVHRGPCNGAASEAEFTNGITRERALELLAAETTTAANAVLAAVTVPLTQTQLDALISFTFNVGVGAFRGSTLLQEINAGHFDQVPTQMNRWTRGGNRVLPGLVRRRAAEGNLFTTGAYE
jgi:GH24 family phage-related lysozyme (muramidase)